MSKKKHNERLKPREGRTLSPEKLYGILCGIYPTETADELMEKLTNMEDEASK